MSGNSTTSNTELDWNTMTNTDPMQLSLPFLEDISNINMRSPYHSRLEFYDMIHEGELYDVLERLEVERSDGWIFLYKSLPGEGYINIINSPDIEMTKSIASRWSCFGHDRYEIIDSIYVSDRRQIYNNVLDRAKPLSSGILEGSYEHQWLRITDSNAITALRSEI